MKKNDWLICSVIIAFYILILLTFKRSIFFNKFDHSLIDRYYLSQDITHEVNGTRLFLSDSDIYLATGYLYATGHDPSLNNFEHPPLIKYLFGFSILLFNNPYMAQIFLGILMLISMYIVTKKVYSSVAVSLIATLLLLVDPLFIDLSSQPLLDLGQTLFLLLYFLTMLYYKDNYLLQGITLGFFASTKFWIPTFFFIVLFAAFKIYKKQINYRTFYLQFIVAFLVYTLLYTQTFILQHGRFNIFWHFLKTIKYRLVHNSSLYPGASIIMYTTSYVKTWWGKHTIVSTSPWSPFWTISFLLSIWNTYKHLYIKIIDIKLLVSIIPLGYLCYLGVQAPFSRYFFPILPFSYMILADFLNGKIKELPLGKKFQALF